MGTEILPSGWGRNWNSPRRRRTRLWSGWTLLLLALPAMGGQAKSKVEPAPLYELVELPLRPIAISNSELVAGTINSQHASTWSATTGLYQIPLPAEFSFSECTGINSHGETAGTASTADSSRRIAFLFRQKKVTFLPGAQSRANSINDAGTIVGQAILPGSTVATAVLWRRGSAMDLKICCAGSGRSINGSGLVIGDTYDQSGHYHAFLWDAAQGARLLAVPGEEYSSALALNNRGEVLVKASPGGLFLYSGSRLQPIDIPKGTPRAFNKSGVVVGSFGGNPDAQKAFVWDKTHGLQDLNTLISPNSGWELEVASSINDRGEIVGWGDHAGKENVGFLLRPTRKPR